MLIINMCPKKKEDSTRQWQWNKTLPLGHQVYHWEAQYTPNWLTSDIAQSIWGCKSYFSSQYLIAQLVVLVFFLSPKQLETLQSKKGQASK